jgi:hypothetical protein
MKKISNFIMANKANFFAVAAICYILLICILNSLDVPPRFGENGFSWHDLLVEGNGMIADLIIFGCNSHLMYIWGQNDRQ